MTGQTTARAAGGSELAVAWVKYVNEGLEMVIAFEEGMTWEQWLNSDYHLYCEVNNGADAFGIKLHQLYGLACYWLADGLGVTVNFVYDSEIGQQPSTSDIIKPGFTYTTTA